MDSKKRVVVDLNTKIKVIEASEKDKLSVKEIVDKFKIGKTQVYGILKKKTELKSGWLNSSGLTKRRARKTGNEEINELVWKWFVSARTRRLPISGPILQHQAKEIAERLGRTEFTASNGWLESFRRRNKISFKEVCDEAGDVCKETVDEWKTKLAVLLKNYSPKDVANGDETGLFYRALPGKTLMLKGERCTGGNLSEERLTVFICGFMTGELEKPLVIGKAGKPRCFKNINKKNLPVEWRSNKKAWMTSHIMEEWLIAFNARMKNQRRHVLLFLDYATCHPHVSLSNVKLAWFPPNTTSVTQPMDQGIINCVKMNYRKFVMKALIANMESASSSAELTKSITVLDAVIWLAEAVKQVSFQTVQRCFQKANFLDSSLEIMDCDNGDETLQEELNQVNYRNITAEDYISIDKVVETEANISEFDEFIQDYLHGKNNESEDENDNDEDELSNTEEECSVKTYSAALSAINELQSFSLHKGDAELFDIICQARILTENRAAAAKSSKQSTPFDFWKK